MWYFSLLPTWLLVYVNYMVCMFYVLGVLIVENLQVFLEFLIFFIFNYQFFISLFVQVWSTYKRKDSRFHFAFCSKAFWLCKGFCSIVVCSSFFNFTVYVTMFAFFLHFNLVQKISLRKFKWYSCFWQLMILSLLKGVGNTVLRVTETESLLCELLERRCQNLAKIEVEILCLLLEVSWQVFWMLCLFNYEHSLTHILVFTQNLFLGLSQSCAMPNSFDEHIFEDHLLKALKVRSLWNLYWSLSNLSLVLILTL